MKERRSAILCLVATTNYSWLTTETFYYGWAAVTGKNMFKSGIFIYTFLFTEYSSVQSKISSLVLSLFPMKENPWSRSFPIVFVLIILILRSRNGTVVRMLDSHQCGLGFICGLSLLLIFSFLRGFCQGILDFLPPRKESLKNQSRLMPFPSLRPNADQTNFTYEVALSNWFYKWPVEEITPTKIENSLSLAFRA